MSKTTTTAKIRSDGTVVEVLAGGTERPFPEPSMRPMTEAEIEAAAGADPEAFSTITLSHPAGCAGSRIEL